MISMYKKDTSMVAWPTARPVQDLPRLLDRQRHETTKGPKGAGQMEHAAGSPWHPFPYGIYFLSNFDMQCKVVAGKGIAYFVPKSILIISLPHWIFQHSASFRCVGLIPDKSVFHFEHVTLHDFEHPWADGKPESKALDFSEIYHPKLQLETSRLSWYDSKHGEIEPNEQTTHRVDSLSRILWNIFSVEISAIQEMWPAVHVSQEAKAEWAGSDEWRWPGVDFVFVNIDMQCRDISRI